MRGIRARLGYANVIATLALFVALGGGAYAALKLPPKSVGTKQLKQGAVVSTKVKDASLLAGDFKPGELPKGEKGNQGDQGLPGPTASSFSSHAPAAVSIGAATTQVMALTDGFSGGPLVLSFEGRIVVNGSIWVTNSAPATTSVSCVLKIAPEGGAFIAFSNQTFSSLPATSGAQVPLVGAIDKPAGSYNVNVGCSSPGPQSFFLQGDLTALATAR